MQENECRDLASASVTNGFKTLLSEKHLYQSVIISDPSALELVKQYMKDISLNPKRFPNSARPPPQQLIEEKAKAIIAQATWVPSIPSLEGVYTIQSVLQFALPTVNTFCSHCESSFPCNPVTDTPVPSSSDGEGNQSFWLGYECQNCKTRPIRFLIRRERNKITLCGRDPIEVYPSPSFLPKLASKYFGSAHVAHHAGQTLAGLFLLRVFVEQFWRSIPDVAQLIESLPRATGDEQGSAYQRCLPQHLRDSIPSLTAIYNDLSSAIHAARADAVLFETSAEKIVNHFEIRRAFKLP